MPIKDIPNDFSICTNTKQNEKPYNRETVFPVNVCMKHTFVVAPVFFNTRKFNLLLVKH